MAWQKRENAAWDRKRENAAWDRKELIRRSLDIFSCEKMRDDSFLAGTIMGDADYYQKIPPCFLADLH